MGDQESEVEKLMRTFSDLNAEPIPISYAVIKSITKNFAQVIAEGGFGVVYLGMLNHGYLHNVMVAVKKVHIGNDYLGELFSNEVTFLKMARHKNIVRFLGYCADTQGEVMQMDGKNIIAESCYRFLCFEYVPNGDLQNYLKEKTHGYEWYTRYHIIKGICQGLEYLEQKGIAHLDLKPANVLLGDDMVPKITDFGLSRYINQNESIFTGNAPGTPGYIAPEGIRHGQISLKSDIYSLGVIMKRLLTGKTDDIPENWHESLDGNCRLMKKCIKIAQWCAQDDPCKRPSMHDIIIELKEEETDILEVRLAVNEPRDDPMSSLYQIVQKFQSLSLRALCDHYRSTGVYEDLDVLERILEGSDKPSSIPYQLLQFITNNFKRRIAHNDFGESFKGILQVVAVTRLFRSLNVSDRMFHRGVEQIRLVQHKNVARFLGNCSYAREMEVENDGKITNAEIWDRLLCFEYSRNGSLEKHISDELRGLHWNIRYQIIKGICEGLSHLHKNKNNHMDLVPSSILLDDGMVPKIIHFGISTLTSNKHDPRHLGYYAPERMMDGVVSLQTDIYSLGVIILELVTGSKEKPNITNVLRRWKHRWNNTSVKHTPIEYHQVCKCIELALSCMHENPNRRPFISHIIHVLNELDNAANTITFNQMSPRLDDMLGIEPLELHFPIEVSKEISRSVELTNDTDYYFAFTMAPSSSLPYRTQPNKGVVPPRSKFCVTITSQPLETAPPPCKNDSYRLYVRSTRVKDSLRAEGVTEDLFDEDSREVVDKVDLNIIMKSEVSKVSGGSR